MKWLFFHFDSDASTFEKVVEVFVPVAFVALFLFMNLSGLGLFNNCYAQSCRHAGFLWHVLGIAFSAYAVYFYWRGATDRSKLNIDPLLRTIATFILILISWQCYTGWNWWFDVCQ